MLHPLNTGVSYGTATLLGYNKSKCGCLPLTAYLISGARCSKSCAFCPRGNMINKGSMLSRISWPEYEFKETAERIKRAFEAKKLQRACFQTVYENSQSEKTSSLIRELKGMCSIPVSVSAGAVSEETAKKYIDAGAEFISIPIDCASERLFSSIKKASYRSTMDILVRNAERFPGRIRTHIIAGLGETEEEMADFLTEMHKRRIGTGLFAFTPIKGTEMKDCPPPEMAYYRKLQLASWLMEKGFGGLISIKEGLIFFSEKIYGLEELEKEKGKIFMTSGCPGCNRPYYNERPGQTPYNYPEMPDGQKSEEALRLALSGNTGKKQ